MGFEDSRVFEKGESEKVVVDEGMRGGDLNADSRLTPMTTFGVVAVLQNA